MNADACGFEVLGCCANIHRVTSVKFDDYANVALFQPKWEYECCLVSDMLTSYVSDASPLDVSGCPSVLVFVQASERAARGASPLRLGEASSLADWSKCPPGDFGANKNDIYAQMKSTRWLFFSFGDELSP